MIRIRWLFLRSRIAALGGSLFGHAQAIHGRSAPAPGRRRYQRGFPRPRLCANEKIVLYFIWKNETPFFGRALELERSGMAIESVCRMDAAAKPPWKGLRRLSIAMPERLSHSKIKLQNL